MMADVEDDGPSLDININNVVSTYSTKCHLNLRTIAMNATNTEYHRQHGMLNMRLRRPYTTASIWSSGKITCTGALSEADAKIAGRKFARKIQKLGYRVKFTNFRIVNVLGTCSLPFWLDIVGFSRKHREASYEPELHPGVTYRITDPKATLKIFSTGSITITAPRVANIQSAVEYIYPLVVDFKRKPKNDIVDVRKHVPDRKAAASDHDSSLDSDEFDSEESMD